MGKTINAYTILVGKPLGKQPPERLSRSLKDNIRMHCRDGM
jgi:hypothetical protein